MKRLLFLALFLLPLTSSAFFEKNLSFGLQKNSDVLALQELLTDEGLYTGPITGNFFSLTLKAVKNFQTVNGITPVSGYVGPLTRAKLNEKLNLSDETGAELTPAITPPKTNDDVVAKLNEQNLLLQKQLDELKKQQDVLGQIVQNTLPPPVYVPPPLPPPPPPKPVKKDVRIDEVKYCFFSADGKPMGICRTKVSYFENEQKKPTSITISSEKGTFTTVNETVQRQGNPLTTETTDDLSAYFDFIPNQETIEKRIDPYGIVTYSNRMLFTVSANGVTRDGDFNASVHFPLASTTSQ